MSRSGLSTSSLKCASPARPSRHHHASGVARSDGRFDFRLHSVRIEKNLADLTEKSEKKKLEVRHL